MWLTTAAGGSGGRVFHPVVPSRLAWASSAANIPRGSTGFKKWWSNLSSRDRPCSSVNPGHRHQQPLPGRPVAQLLGKPVAVHPRDSDVRDHRVRRALVVAITAFVGVKAVWSSCPGRQLNRASDSAASRLSSTIRRSGRTGNLRLSDAARPVGWAAGLFAGPVRLQVISHYLTATPGPPGFHVTRQVGSRYGLRPAARVAHDQPPRLVPTPAIPTQGVGQVTAEVHAVNNVQPADHYR